MDAYRAKVEVLSPPSPWDRERTEKFLRNRGLESEGDAEVTAVVLYDDSLAATASLAGNVIKEVAVDPIYEGEGLAALAISRLIAEAHDRGRSILRVFTSPGNEAIFASLGFVRLATSGSEAILLESDPRAFDRWVGAAATELERQYSARNGQGDRASRMVLAGVSPEYRVGAVVVNCNPFTKGHRSLIERAGSHCQRLIVFVLEADKSSFPAAVRYDLVQKGIADLPNVAVIPSGPYIISEATFPTYFLKEKNRATEIHARMDVTLFATRLAPALGIEARFMGTEPYCAVTNLYNTLMKEILPAKGIVARELPRLENAGSAISASSVRSALREGNWRALEALVPETTLTYLRTPEAAPVIERIKAGLTRH